MKRWRPVTSSSSSSSLSDKGYGFGNARPVTSSLSEKGVYVLGNSSKGVYAVCETMTNKDDQYLIYKLDQLAWKNDEYFTFQKPILVMKVQEFPPNMFVFSLRSKIYFCGGIEQGRRRLYSGKPDYYTIYIRKAYMFDLKSNQQGIVPINPMNFPKPNPLVFGPVDGHKFYVFSDCKHRLGDCDPSFEMLDTNTNSWESLQLPHTRKAGMSDLGHSSALVGTNILITSNSPPQLYAFCTRTAIWRVIKYHGDPRSVEPHNLPFRTAHCLCRRNRSGHILFGLHGLNGLPELYLSYKLPPVKNNYEEYDPVGHFKHLGIPEGLMAQLGNNAAFLSDTNIGTDIYYFDYEDKVCIVRYSEPEYARFTFDVFDVCLLKGNGVNVKMEKTLQYNYLSSIRMVPKHVLFA